MNTFFISDLHFGHEKLARLRGFPNADAMNYAIRESWNGVVSQNDVVYVIGDISFAKPGPTAEFFWFLKGRIKIVPGNHDSDKTLKLLAAVDPGIEILPSQVLVKVAEPQPDGTNIVTKVVLNHFPLLVWEESHLGTIHLHGHSHGSCRYPDDVARMDVGCEPMGFTPISMKQVRERLAGKDVPRWDHHVPKIRPAEACNDPDGADTKA